VPEVRRRTAIFLYHVTPRGEWRHTTNALLLTSCTVIVGKNLFVVKKKKNIHLKSRHLKFS